MTFLFDLSSLIIPGCPQQAALFGLQVSLFRRRLRPSSRTWSTDVSVNLMFDSGSQRNRNVLCPTAIISVHMWEIRYFRFGSACSCCQGITLVYTKRKTQREHVKSIAKVIWIQTLAVNWSRLSLRSTIMRLSSSTCLLTAVLEPCNFFSTVLRHSIVTPNVVLSANCSCL